MNLRDLIDETDPLKPSIQVFNKHNQRKKDSEHRALAQSQVWPKNSVLLPLSALARTSSGDSEMEFERKVSEMVKDEELFKISAR